MSTGVKGDPLVGPPKPSISAKPTNGCHQNSLTTGQLIYINSAVYIAWTEVRKLISSDGVGKYPMVIVQ